MMINTANGPKSPGEALEIFKRAQLPTGSLLGIYTQLLESERGTEATLFVTKNLGKFNDKIQRMAREQSTGRPIGIKRITSATQALEILRSAGLRPTMQITFRKDRPRNVTNVTALQPRLIRFFDTNAEMFLVSCVRPSGEWQGITRTYIVTVNATTDHELEELARAFEAAIESVELRHNMVDRVSAVQAGVMEKMLQDRTDLFYDESVFRATCGKLNRSSEADMWIGQITDSNAPLSKVIEVIPVMSRIVFLEQYIGCFDAAMASA